MPGLAHDPEQRAPVFHRDKRQSPFARKSCANNKLKARLRFDLTQSRFYADSFEAGVKRAATASASSSNSAANTNGAPGSFAGAFGPMK